MAEHRVVVWDARGPANGGWAEGEVIEVDQQVRLTLAERPAVACALPVDPELLPANPAAGYVRRGWGRGEELGGNAALRHCPMLLWAVADRGYVHWAARVCRTSAKREPSGYLRLMPLPGLAGAFSGGLAATGEAVDLGALVDRPEVHGGGWLVGGVVGVSVALDGYLGLCLAGTAADVAALWSAATQCGRSG